MARYRQIVKPLGVSMHISELFDADLLQYHLDNGTVKSRRNADDNLTIYNYTSVAQVTRAWDEVTRACRGLIVDDEGTIIARPLPKFFNLSENDQYDEDITPDTPVKAYDKLDGSLGIVYWDKEGNPQVATRGSFDSVMAVHASERIKDLLIPNFTSITILVEIIYPENQIVLDYQGRDDLFLIGGVDIASGEFLDPIDVLAEIRGVYPSGGFNYIVQDYDQIKTVQDALDNLNRTNREGFVLHTYEGTMVKVKQPDYIEMHKAVFQTSKRNIWYYVAYDLLAGLGVDREHIKDKYIKSSADQIFASGGKKELPKLVEILPEKLGASAENTYKEITDEVKSSVVTVLDFVEREDIDMSDRSSVYAIAEDELGKHLAGHATSIVFAESDEASKSQFDKLVQAVIGLNIPKKGDRLTEALTEEEE